MFVCRVVFGVQVFDDVVVSMYSGRFVKTLLFLCRGFDWVKSFYLVKASVKAFSVTPLYVLFPDGGARYVLDEGFKLGSSSIAWFDVSFVSRDISFIDVVSQSSECVAEFWGKRFKVSIQSIEVTPVKNLSIGFSDPRSQLVKMVFKTPVLLSTKLMAPPLESFRKKLKRIGSAYVLYPSTGHICSYLSKLWRVATGETIHGGLSEEWSDYYMGRLCEVVLIPIDLEVKPRTVRYDEKRSVRGFTGYILLKLGLNRKKIIDKLDKLFALANTLGIGKSRSIGFGVTKVTTVKYIQKDLTSSPP